MSESEHSDRVDLYLFVSDLVKGSLMTTTLTLKASVLAGEEPALISMFLPQPPQYFKTRNVINHH